MEDTGPKNEIIIYEGGSGQPRIEVRVENETVWLTQDRIAELFGVKRPAITKHLKNIFESGELLEKEVSSILEHTTRHGAISGKTQIAKSKLYNLDAIISIGYRVNSATATKFRQWATGRIRLYCLRWSSSLLIVGTGGLKTAQTYQKDMALRHIVPELQELDKLIMMRQRSGDIEIDHNNGSMRGNLIFSLEDRL